MKKDYTHIIFVLDRSGSMNSVVTDTIGGFNTFLKEQKEVKGEATVTFIQFDDKYEVNADFVDISQIKELDHTTFVPRGYTALFDAIGKTIVSVGEKLIKMKKKNIPEKVIFVILTDGAENSSKEYRTYEVISKMIKRQTEKYNWMFVFLGADEDSMDHAKGMGIKMSNFLSVDSSGIGHSHAYSTMSRKMACAREDVAARDFCEMDFFDSSDKSEYDEKVKEYKNEKTI